MQTCIRLIYGVNRYRVIVSIGVFYFVRMITKRLWLIFLFLDILQGIWMIWISHFVFGVLWIFLVGKNFLPMKVIGIAFAHLYTYFQRKIWNIQDLEKNYEKKHAPTGFEPSNLNCIFRIPAIAFGKNNYNFK